jgi:hypothetical protein
MIGVRNGGGPGGIRPGEVVGRGRIVRSFAARLGSKGEPDREKHDLGCPADTRREEQPAGAWATTLLARTSRAKPGKRDVIALNRTA